MTDLQTWEEFDLKTIEKIKNMKQSDIQECLLKYFRVKERTRRGMLKIRAAGSKGPKKAIEKKESVNST